MVEPGDLRDRLLEQAAQLLDTDGVEAVTIRAVARRAQVSHGAPRRHFATRAQLLGTLARDGFLELVRRLDALAADDPPDERLAQAARSYLAFARERPALFDLMTRHDLLEGSGVGLRGASLPTLARWHELVRAARPAATEQDSLLLFAHVHGVAALHSHGALSMLGYDPEPLLVAVLAQRA